MAIGCYVRRPSKFDQRFGAPLDRDRMLRYLTGKWGHDDTLEEVVRSAPFLIQDFGKVPKKPIGFDGQTRQS